MAACNRRHRAFRAIADRHPRELYAEHSGELAQIVSHTMFRCSGFGTGWQPILDYALLGKPLVAVTKVIGDRVVSLKPVGELLSR